MILSLLEDDNGFKDYNMNEHYRYVGFASEIQLGKCDFFQFVDGCEKSVNIAVVNIDGLYYAIPNTCFHKGTTLSIEFMEGEIVVCSWYG
jgi:nitrite reductase/ring-hydroxylating ferredoxin subunit